MYGNDNRMMDNGLYFMDLVVYGVECVEEFCWLGSHDG